MKYKKKTISLHPLIIKIRSENSAEVAQLVEHHLAPKDKRFQPWEGKSDIGRLQMRKENSAEVAQLVEHNLAKVGVADSSSVFRSLFIDE